MNEREVSKRIHRGTPIARMAHASAEERRAYGRSLRDVTPRNVHAQWKPAPARRDPVALLLETNEGRLPSLVPIRLGRMSASPFAFYRGAAALMAADLACTAVSGLRVQGCGDAHLMNFGGFATPERNVIFDINDLDETLPAPWEWDLKRLATSAVIAAQDLRFSGSDAGRVANDVAREYRERSADYSAMRVLDVWYDKIDLQHYEDRRDAPEQQEEVRRRAAGRIEAEQRKTAPEHLFPKLATVEGASLRIRDEPPLIFHPTGDLASGSHYEKAISTYRESLPEHTRVMFDRFRFLDLALKVVGVGSVGLRSAVALFMADDDDPLFLQIKEARASVLEPYAGESRHANHGERVTVGQRLMQSASDALLGWTRGKDGHDYYVRQLRDMKLSADIEDWDVPLLRQYARMCAHALARAHARSGDAAMLAGYMGSGRGFDEAIADFAVAYADQNLTDYRSFLEAIRRGRVSVVRED
jgi:uncharacterized protein (DUF2252 family)